MINYVSPEAPAPGTTSVSSISRNRPASVAEHDLLLAVLYVGTSTLTPAPSDWTWLAEPNPANFHVRIAYKVAGASEPGSYTFEVSGRTDLFGGIVAYRGANRNDPINASGYAVNSAASLSWGAPSVDTTRHGCHVVRVFAASNSRGAHDITAPEGSTERFKVNQQTSTTFRMLYLSDADQLFAGPTGSAAHASNRSTIYDAWTLMINPFDVTPPAAPRGLKARTITAPPTHFRIGGQEDA
jgi:hypothetical protein